MAGRTRYVRQGTAGGGGVYGAIVKMERNMLRDARGDHLPHQRGDRLAGECASRVRRQRPRGDNSDLHRSDQVRTPKYGAHRTVDYRMPWIDPERVVPDRFAAPVLRAHVANAP